MRSREFLMKDAYSFDLDFEGAKAAYDRMFVAYLRTFERMGLKAIPMRADTGPIGGDLSHEFIILASTGESEVFCHADFMKMPIPGADTNFRDDAALAKIVKDWTTPYAATSEMHDAAVWEKIGSDNQVAARGIEVGHIFHFGTKYSDPMNAKVMGPDGKEHTVYMGSYGIGPTRVVAAAIEAGHDENGIIWPDAIAPFNVGIINMKAGDAACNAASEKIYAALEKAGIDVLLDDTDERAGSKFATADLIGLPLQVIVGPRGIASGEVEIKVRKTGAKENLSVDAAIKRITGAS
jgi:prolyl-tRNA synthetase